jgi:Asp-tRNA(Asn)/Glu-tRNA(Gln) amidotransferase A subunit family amidase
MVDLAELTAEEAAIRIRDGSILATTYVAAQIERQLALSELNAVISFDPDVVLEQARRVDQKRQNGEMLGKLAGVPFVVKDQIETAFYPTTAGTPALKGYRADRNGPVVQRLLDADAVLFATANMHELASGGTSNNPTFGPVRNPYDLSRSPGGSSGGTAAAIAAGITPIGLGEDTGGSVRIPAGFCGIAGLRPSTWPVKLYPDDGLVPPAEPDDTQTIGPMARTVSDLALVHGVITGQPAPAPQALRSLRLGVPDQRFWTEQPLASEVVEVARDAIDRLEAAGVTVVNVDLTEIITLGARLAGIVPAGNRELFRDWLAAHLPPLSYEDVVKQIASRDVRAMYQTDRPRPGQALSPELQSAARRAAVTEFSAMLGDAGVDALAFPNPLILPPPIVPGGDPATPMVTVGGQPRLLAAVALPTMTFGSRLGAPGLTLPIGLAQGLPVGMELTARPGQDAEILAMGMAIERTLGRITPPDLH